MASAEQSVGLLGELLVTGALVRLGFTVLTPILPESYDMFVISKKGRASRLQVKSTQKPVKHRAATRYSFTAKRGNGANNYSKQHADFLVFVALDNGSCWIIPTAPNLPLRFNIPPDSTQSKYYRYTEAWGQLE